VQLYVGDQVRVLGVPIGRVDALAAVPHGIRVDFAYDADAPVPADARAAIMAPTLVTGRYVELAPARIAGPRLADGALIGLDRTAVPIEFDQIKQQLDELSTALGPEGANKDGALSRAISTVSSGLKGNASTLNQTLDRMAGALGAVSDGREDLFATVRNLQVLAGALREADSQIPPFVSKLRSVSGVLADSSGDLGRMLDTLDSSVQEVGEFVKRHSGQLGNHVGKFADLAKAVSDNRQALADLLQRIPGPVSNVTNIYDPYTGSINGGLSATQFHDLAAAACSALLAQGPVYDQCKSAFAPALKQLNMDYPPLAFNGLQRNGSANCIYARNGPAPDPTPELDTRMGQEGTKPNQGAGERPLGAGCGPGASAGPGGIERLFVPGGGR
jgi:phospholipid/cholesterol/gamma-HCH transport system substrate-binding protein